MYAFVLILSVSDIDIKKTKRFMLLKTGFYSVLLTYRKSSILKIVFCLKNIEWKMFFLRYKWSVTKKSKTILLLTRIHIK